MPQLNWKSLILKLVVGIVLIGLFLGANMLYYAATLFNPDKAAAGDARSEYYIAHPDLHHPLKEKRQLAVKLLQHSAVQNFDLSEFSLGLLYMDPEENRDIIEQNPTEAARWFLKYSEQNFDNDGSKNIDPWDIFDLSMRRGSHNINDHTRLASIAGILGQMFYNGIGVKQDYAQAFKWYKRAYDLGTGHAEGMLGALYLWGNGTAKDAQKGLAMLHKWADQGDSLSEYEIGRAYLYGTGVPQDAKEAVKWFQKGLNEDSAFSEVTMGRLYQVGMGVEKDNAAAVKLFQKAADGGNAKGAYFLAQAYLNGDGIAMDKREGVKWLYRAARGGYDVARYELGLICDQGLHGFAPDKKEAFKWYSLAADQGNQDAIAKMALFKQP